MYKLLDLYCGAGGAGFGYHLAGFDVTGVDIYPQKPPYNFIRDDAIRYLQHHYNEYDFIHASPPCQYYSIVTPWHIKSKYADHIPFLREVLNKTGKPYIIENTPTAPLVDPILLCGEMFGLRVIRHRIFECSQKLPQPYHNPHQGQVRLGHYVTVAGHGPGNTKGNNSINVWREVMEMPWAKYKQDLAEAIPPKYTEYLGKQALVLMGDWSV